MAILNSKGEKVDGSLIAIYEESGQMFHKQTGKWYASKTELRKLTKADEFLKLDNLINDKDVNKAIEEEAERFADLQIMTDRNNK